MDLDKGAFGSGGASSADINAMKQDISALKAKITTTQYAASPAEGGNVIAPVTTSVILIIELTPAADLSALTVTLPPVAQSTTGQRVFIHSMRNIDALTFTSDGTVDNRMVSMSPGDSVDFTKTNATTWSRGV